MRRTAIILLTAISALLTTLWIASWFWVTSVAIPISHESSIAVRQFAGRFQIERHYGNSRFRTRDKIHVSSRHSWRGSVYLDYPTKPLLFGLFPRPKEGSWFIHRSHTNPGPAGTTTLSRSTLRLAHAHLVLSAILAAWPLRCLIVAIHRRRLKGIVCSSCGYDLRGTPLRSACPECGSPVVPLEA